MAELTSRVHLWAVAAVAALASCVAAWIVVGASAPAALVFGSLAVVPLLVLLAALVRKRRRAFAAGTLCLIPYLVLALTELIANPAARVWAAGTLILAFAAFVACIAYLRVSRTS